MNTKTIDDKVAEIKLESGIVVPVQRYISYAMDNKAFAISNGALLYRDGEDKPYRMLCPNFVEGKSENNNI